MEKAAWNTDIVFFPTVFFDLPEQASGKWLVSYLVRTDGKELEERARVIANQTLKEALQGITIEELSVSQEVLRKIFFNTKD